MTPLLPIGLAIALNATVLGAGVVWLRRQSKRVAAEKTAEYRGLFKLEPLPSPGDEVLILVEEDDGRTSEIDAVHWPHLGWTDARRTFLKVDDDVLGWRPFPFRREPPPIGVTGWTPRRPPSILKTDAPLQSR